MGVPLGVNYTLSVMSVLPFNTYPPKRPDDITFYQMYEAPKLCESYARPGNSSIPIVKVVIMWERQPATLDQEGVNNCRLTVHSLATGAPSNVSVVVKVNAVSRNPLILIGAPNGTYWLCGKNANYNLPPDWGGTCMVGFVVPAMRGGTCAIIGDECCTSVPDVVFNVTHLANFIADKRHQGPEGWQLTTWSKGLFGAWGPQIGLDF
ncbi:unnamed protein product, partial [Coregonus sp. 'balchen']